MNINEYIKERLAANTFLQYLGLQPTQADSGCFEGMLVVEKHHLQQDDLVHGGVLASLCDIACGFASYSMLAPQQRCLTVELKVSYYNPAVADRIYCKGWVAKAGGRLHFTESEIYYMKNETKIMVAKASATMAII